MPAAMPAPSPGDGSEMLLPPVASGAARFASPPVFATYRATASGAEPVPPLATSLVNAAARGDGGGGGGPAARRSSGDRDHGHLLLQPVRLDVALLQRPLELVRIEREPDVGVAARRPQQLLERRLVPLHHHPRVRADLV